MCLVMLEAVLVKGCLSLKEDGDLVLLTEKVMEVVDVIVVAILK